MSDECGCVNAEHHLMEVLRNTEAALRESQAREAALTKALALEAVDVALARTWCRICRTENRSNERSRAAHPHEASCPLASPSDAARSILNRLDLAEYSAERAGMGGRMAKALAEADRDRWLGHVRRFMGRDDLQVSSEHGVPCVCQCSLCDAARRDLEQHDAGRGK